jgi:diguanylate cyclase (GGDEF)-like protein/PAS domain S-box-containing protein
VDTQQIAELRKTQRALQASQDQLAEVQRIGAIGSAVHDLVTGDIFRSDEYFRILGLESGSMPSNLQLVSMVHPDDRSAFAGMLEDAIARGVVFDTTIRITRPDAEQRWVRCRLAPQVDEVGTVVALLGTLFDETDQRRAKDRSERLAAIVESSDDAIIAKSLDGIILEWNAGAERMYGYQPAEVIGRAISILAPADRPDEMPALLERVTRGLRVEHIETVRVHKDGSNIDVSITVSPLRDSEGTIMGASTIARDIGDAKRAGVDLATANRGIAIHADELERRNHSLTLMNTMSEMLGSIESEAEAYQIVEDFGTQLFPNVSGTILITNPSGTLLEAVGRWGNEVHREAEMPPADCWAVRRGRICGRPSALNTPRCRHITEALDAYLCVPLIAQGRTIGVMHLVAPAVNGEDNPQLDPSTETVSATFMESLALALANFRLREMLQVQSIRDPLTGLFNRRFMDDALDRELKRAVRRERPFGLLMIDIDHFKRWNDTFGHDAGDVLIREVSRVLEQHTRGEDIASRYGGDEFLVALPETSLEVCIRRAEELHLAIRNLDVHHRDRVLGTITVTIGVASYPENTADPEGLTRAADQAMYSGKRAGRDTTESAPPIRMDDGNPKEPIFMASRTPEAPAT